ncbi:hypothetical protein Tco_0312812 [Tanacetum coccineum]
MTKAKDQRSQSMKEQAYNVDKDKDHKSLTTKAISLISRRSVTMNSLRGRLLALNNESNTKVYSFRILRESPSKPEPGPDFLVPTPTHSNDPLLSGEDRLKLTELMDMCTKLTERVLDLEHTKTAQAQEIKNLKLRVKKLEKKVGLRTHKFKRLYKVGVTRRVHFLDDDSLGAQEDASNQGRSNEDIHKDAKVSLVDETLIYGDIMNKNNL